MPVRMPSRSQTAASASSCVLPAPGPEAACRPVDLHGAGTDRDAPSWRPTATGSRGRGSPPARRRRSRHHRRDTIGDFFEDHRTRGVDDVHALAPGVGHDPGLLGQLLRRDRCAPSSRSPPSRDRSRGPARSAATAMSASVQCVAMRTIATPRSRIARMSSLVPSPGSISAAILAVAQRVDRRAHQHALVDELNP